MLKTLTSLDVLEEMFARDLLDPQSEVYRDYVWQKNGDLGELECLDWLRRALPGAVIHHDLELDYNGQTQVDLLVLADQAWWVIEVKNYLGVFSYDGVECKLRGQSMRSDQVVAMRNRVRIIKELAHAIDSRIQVEASMIFIHKEGEAVLAGEEDFAVVMRHQLNRHLEAMRGKHHWRRNGMAQDYYQIIMRYHKPYPQVLPVVSEADWMRMKKGCRCEKCRGYRLESRKKLMVCQGCGHSMTKRQLAQDLYCQLCVLFHHDDKAVTISRLCELSAGQISKTTFYYSLSPYIKKYNKYRFTYLHNYALPKKKLESIFKNTEEK